MELHFDDASIAKFTPHLGADKKILLTFEDGVGPYSQHAMIHMQVQFSFNIVPATEATPEYDVTIPSNLGPIGIKGYSQEDLDEHLSVHFISNTDSLTLTGDVGLIDANLGFIDFTDANGIKNNPAR